MSRNTRTRRPDVGFPTLDDELPQLDVLSGASAVRLWLMRSGCEPFRPASWDLDSGLCALSLGLRPLESGVWYVDSGRCTSDCDPWPQVCVFRTLDCGLRTLDFGLRTSDFGLRTSDCGLRTLGWRLTQGGIEDET